MGLYSPPSSPIAPAATVGLTVEVQSAVSGIVLLAANTNRKGVTIFNDSTARLFVNVNATYNAALYAFAIEPGATYNMDERYSGEIMGQWSLVNGRALVTEFT